MWALIIDNIVVELTDIDPADRFHPDLVWVSCGNNVQIGWTYDGKKLSAPVPQTLTSADLMAYAAEKRFAVETGGITLSGSRISTDRASQSLITGAYNFVQANPTETVKFKTAAGFVELTAVQMTAIANAVGAHVQACFAAEGVVDAAISVGTIKTISDIDAASWPTAS